MLAPGDPLSEVALLGQTNCPLMVDAGFGLTGKVLSVTILRPDGTTVGGSAALGNRDVFLTDQSMLKGQWGMYMVQQGDLNQVGFYAVTLNISPLPQGVVPPQASFTVVVPSQVLFNG
jgi:hypothetical protein